MALHNLKKIYQNEIMINISEQMQTRTNEKSSPAFPKVTV